jgi:maleylpyruvate isomerase
MGFTEEQLEQSIAQVERAESLFLETVEGLDQSELTAPSLCEGWTRSHVIGHVALNAHSLVNLMEWARTGKETPQYPGWVQRDMDIERCSTRTKEEHLHALHHASEAFVNAARAVPLERWDFPVRGIGGKEQPVSGYLFGRLREVEIHHVDLDANYSSADWPAAFVDQVLRDIPARLGDNVEQPFTIEADDLSLQMQVGKGSSVATVRGPAHELLIWLLGRSSGGSLASDGEALPALPSWG